MTHQLFKRIEPVKDLEPGGISQVLSFVLPNSKLIDPPRQDPPQRRY